MHVDKKKVAAASQERGTTTLRSEMGSYAAVATKFALASSALFGIALYIEQAPYLNSLTPLRINRPNTIVYDSRHRNVTFELIYPQLSF